MVAGQLKLFRPARSEVLRERGCYVCHGISSLCTEAACPIRLKARTLVALSKAIKNNTLFGASPPGVFIGQYGYPKVSAGPLVPAVSDQDTSVMDAPELWVNKKFDELLHYRLALFRGRAPISVSSARAPDRLLSTVQEIVMSSKPTDTELRLKKRPRLEVLISAREAPTGPAASIRNIVLAENPAVPKSVEKVVYDTDLVAGSAVATLYDSRIPQRQITRLLSVGLLGLKSRRRLVPTEWSITAIDDIIGRALHKQIISFPQIDEFMLFGYSALANNVQVLLLPSAWMYEAMEAWLASSNPTPFSDYELTYGRKTYPTALAGAYHAARLPILEWLRSQRKQAGAVAFLEVKREWIPLGVWRFREICREAMKGAPAHFRTLEESLHALSERVDLPIENWIRVSNVLKHFTRQAKLEPYLR